MSTKKDFFFIKTIINSVETFNKKEWLTKNHQSKSKQNRFRNWEAKIKSIKSILSISSQVSFKVSCHCKEIELGNYEQWFTHIHTKNIHPYF